MVQRIMWAKFYVVDERIRSRVFPNNRLSSPAKFAQPLESNWSINIEFVEPSPEADFYWGTVQFLFEDAPQELLYEGNEFYFMEGNVPVIRVVISHPPEEENNATS